LTAGAAEIGFARRDGISRLAQLYQRDPLRVLFPAPAAGDPPVAVIVTTSGGLVAGDRLDIRVELAPGATAHVTASAAEKVYRSLMAQRIFVRWFDEEGLRDKLRISIGTPRENQHLVEALRLLGGSS